MDDFVGTTAESAAKALYYAATLVSVGVCAARWGLCGALDGEPGSIRLHHPIMSRLSRLGAAAGAVGVVAALARLLAHTAVALGLPEALTWNALSRIALDSQWGSAWRYQVIASVGIALSFLWSARPSWPGWLLATASATSACVAVGLLGHAAGNATRVALHAGHVAGAGVWLGTLAAVVITTRASSAAQDAGERHRLGDLDHAVLPWLPTHAAGTRVTMLRQFSVVALPGSMLLFTSGAWASWLYVGSLPNLMHTAYGQVLVGKLVCVAGVLACGFLNWRRFRAPSGATPRDGTVYVEIALAVLVLVITSILTELAHPGV